MNIVFDCIIDNQMGKVFWYAIVVSCPIPNTNGYQHTKGVSIYCLLHVLYFPVSYLAIFVFTANSAKYQALR